MNVGGSVPGNYSLDILNLPNLQMLSSLDEGDHYRIEAQGNLLPISCPYCANSLYRHGSQRQSYMDTPIHGKRVLLEIERKRFRCKVCGKTLFEPLPDMDGKRQATSRLIRYVEDRCLKKTFLSLAREVGIDDKTVRFIFNDLVKRLETEIRFETPEILGIDEIKIIGEYRTTITNIEKLSLYDLCQPRKKTDIASYFAEIPDRHNVKVIVINMWSHYQEMAKEQFLGKLIVVDKSHVIRMANEALEKVRKRIRKELEAKERIKLKNEQFVLLKRCGTLTEKETAQFEKWSKLFPELKIAYELKEKFFEIYDKGSRVAAESHAKQWELSIPSEVENEFKDLKIALRNWWVEIFNYFEYPVTNTYNESVNNLAKSINRMGRGYSVEVIRARLLFDEIAQKESRTSIRSKPRKTGNDDNRGADAFFNITFGRDYGTDEDLRVVEYGPHIPTLVRLLEEDHFS